MKIVTTNQPNHPYRWITINSYEDIQALPKTETSNLAPETLTVPCLCYFNRYNLMQHGGKLTHHKLLQYTDAPPPQSPRPHSGEKIGIFVFNFHHLEWIDVHEPALRLPSWAVYFALPLSKQNSPSWEEHPDNKAPKERLFRFPTKEKSATQDEIDKAIRQLSETANNPDLIITTSCAMDINNENFCWTHVNENNSMTLNLNNTGEWFINISQLNPINPPNPPNLGEE